MKELSIEQKARRYDEAIEVARKIKNGESIGVPDGTLIPVAIFPELKESEDERFKEELKEVLDECLNVRPQIVEEKQYMRIIAWLEKQGHVKESQISQHENEICKENDDSLTNEDEELRKALYEYFKNRKGDGDIDETWYGISYDKIFAWLEKQGEQKHVDEITSNPDYIGPKDKALFKIATVLSQHEDKDSSPLEEIRSILIDYGINNLESNEKNPVKWSKEDEKTFNDICIDIMEYIPKSFEENSKKVNWLKFLKERYTWKPSDEQVKALNYVVNLMASSESPKENDYYYNVFKDLREQLKKLREE